MPTPTDLVTDLPADFEVFGQAVDTSLADLKGGTTGQILSKTTNADMDFTWIANDQGDITAVTAGTGISGGGTSGAVTITNDMATTITASGDIVVGTGSGTYDNLPIGTTGQVLTADTTVSPYKVKWATPASGGGMTSLATGSITTDLNLTSISQDYKELVLYVSDFTSGSANSCLFRVNNDSGANYYGVQTQQVAANAGALNARNGVTSIDLIVNDRAASTNDNHVVITIPNYTVAAYKLITYQSIVTLDGGTTWGTGTGVIGYKSATAISQLNFLGSTAGTYTLYGVK